MSEGEWKVGRQFSVLENTILDGVAFERGAVFSAQAFGRIGMPSGRSLGLTNPSRRALMDVIVWKDSPSKISPVLRRLIEQDPESPFIRVFVRSEIGVAPARKAMPSTAEKWFEYIESAEPPKRRMPPGAVVTGTQPPIVTATPTIGVRTGGMYVDYTNVLAATNTAAPVVRDEDIEMSVRIDAYQPVRGRTAFARHEYYEGDISVPAVILARGAQAVYDWLLESIAEVMDVTESGDTEYYDEEITQSDEVRIQEQNINAVIRDFNRLYPDLAERLRQQATGQVA